MDFGEQIKTVRLQNGLTQEQMACELHVSRQAVSNWENNRNLPDIELLIEISKTFSVSLDHLILGGDDMNSMTQKLIKDGGETRRARLNAVSVAVGAALLIIGAALLAIKAASVEYVDAQGVLHESFFLLPLAFCFLFGGMIAFLATGARNLVSLLRDKSGESKTNRETVLGISLGVLLMCAGVFLLLLAGNSGANTAAIGIVLAICGAAICAFALIRLAAIRGNGRQ